MRSTSPRSPLLKRSGIVWICGGRFHRSEKGGEKGLFELADKGTIFLDEIGDCSLDIQKKILRVIQERKVMPIGSNRWIPIDIRIISATNQNLEKLVSEKSSEKTCITDLTFFLSRFRPYAKGVRISCFCFTHFSTSFWIRRSKQWSWI